MLLGVWLIGGPLETAAEAAEPTLVQARAEFAASDKALNQIYETARQKLSPGRFEELRRDQRVWLKFREELALAPSYSGVPEETEAAKRSPSYFSSLASITKERIEWIKAGWLAKEGDPDDEAFTAVWRDSSGGYLEIVEADGKLHFLINVVRTRSANLGSIAGVAEWNERIGWFSDRGRDPERTDVTNLAFISRDGKALEVLSANAQHYHGKGAYFDGDYIKVGRLDEAAKARVLKAAQTGVVPE